MLTDWQALATSWLASAVGITLPLPSEVGLGMYVASVVLTALVMWAPKRGRDNARV